MYTLMNELADHERRPRRTSGNPSAGEYDNGFGGSDVLHYVINWVIVLWSWDSGNLWRDSKLEALDIGSLVLFNKEASGSIAHYLIGGLAFRPNSA